MADKKTSAETTATALDGTELIRGVQSGANVKITVDQIKTKVLNNAAASTGTGGTLDLSAVSTGDAGSLLLSSAGDGGAGTLDMRANDSGRAGNINVRGGLTANGGDIDTYDGGGSLNTRGTGSLELGEAGTRTTLTGGATADRAIALPNLDGTLAIVTPGGTLFPEYGTNGLANTGIGLFYANGNPLTSPTNDLLYGYLNGTTLVNGTTGALNYPDGTVLANAAGELHYSGSAGKLADDEKLYYPSGGSSVLADATSLYMPNGPLLCGNGYIYYPDGTSKLAAPGELYYPDGTTSLSETSGNLNAPLGVTLPSGTITDVAASVADASAIAASDNDVDGAKLADVQALQATVNDLLAKLRTAGMLN